MLRVAAEGRARGRCRAEPCLAFPCCASLERRGRYARSGHSGGRCVAAIGQVPTGERLPFPLLACPSPRCPGSSERLLQLLLPPRSRARRAAGFSPSLLRLAGFAGMLRVPADPPGPVGTLPYPSLPHIPPLTAPSAAPSLPLPRAGSSRAAPGRNAASAAVDVVLFLVSALNFSLTSIFSTDISSPATPLPKSRLACL